MVQAQAEAPAQADADKMEQGEMTEDGKFGG